MKTAYALLRKGKYFVQSYSRTTTGIWIASGPVHVVEEGSADELGIKLRDALNGSLEGISHPSQAGWKAVQAPMLAAAGVKTWTTLAKGSKSVGIELVGDVVKFIPSSDYANRGGKSHPEQAVESRFDSNNLGQSLIQAFDACDQGR
ncbi:hypothetical protein [Ralstonia psammae]|uniref:hypothetical protein n=1 Tax=Ralstonia psammae TaxID=3058598 RepID=UPI00292FE881|nr:hypothetical protein [Ralstonia sp. LMG 19083]